MNYIQSLYCTFVFPGGSPSVSQTEGQEEVKEESSSEKKPDDVCCCQKMLFRKISHGMF